jgi:putative membrane protein (TIGR04086 family)
MTLDREPWTPPQSELAPDVRRGVGLTRAVIEGTLASLAIFSVYVVLFALATRHAPYGSSQPGSTAGFIVLLGPAFGGAVAARRHRGRWLAAAASTGLLLALFFLGSTAIWYQFPGVLPGIAVLVLAVLGGLLGRRR